MLKACIEPSSKSLEMLLTGYKTCLKLGQIDHAFSNKFIYFWTFFYSGLPLKSLVENIERFSLELLNHKQTFLFLMLLPLWQCTLNLTGRSEDPANMEMGDALVKENLVGGNPRGLG